MVWKGLMDKVEKLLNGLLVKGLTPGKEVF